MPEMNERRTARERPRPEAAVVDAAYTAYDKTPIDAPDAWGDLASFLEMASVGAPSPPVSRTRA